VLLIIPCVGAAAWLFVGNASALTLTGFLAALGLLGISATLIVAAIDISSVKLTPIAIKRRRWGRSIALRWDEVSHADWKNDRVILSGGRVLIVVPLALYLNRAAVAEFIASRTVRP
jgi:hypothetical protein